MSHPKFEPGTFGAAANFPSHCTAWSACSLWIYPGLNCAGFDLTIFLKCMSVYVSVHKITLASVARESIHKI